MEKLKISLQTLLCHFHKYIELYRPFWYLSHVSETRPTSVVPTNDAAPTTNTLKHNQSKHNFHFLSLKKFFYPNNDAQQKCLPTTNTTKAAAKNFSILSNLWQMTKEADSWHCLLQSKSFWHRSWDQYCKTFCHYRGHIKLKLVINAWFEVLNELHHK